MSYQLRESLTNRYILNKYGIYLRLISLITTDDLIAYTNIFEEPSTSAGLVSEKYLLCFISNILQVRHIHILSRKATR